MHPGSMDTSLPHASLPPPPPPRPESPAIWDLLKNQIVIDLYKENYRLDKRINSLHERVSDCMDKFHELWDRYGDIKEQNLDLLQEINRLRKLETAQVQVSEPISRDSSLAPSDSISQAPYNTKAHSDIDYRAGLGLVDQPALRPSQYPIEILWDREDATADPIVGVSKTNKSRPSMQKSIRNANGTLISPAQWCKIRSIAIVAVRDILYPLVAKAEALGHQRPFGKTYYKKNWPKQWDIALAQVERHEPLLRLCSLHWKAEHVLSLFLSNPVIVDKPTAGSSMTPHVLSQKRKSNSPSPLQCKKIKA